MIDICKSHSSWVDALDGLPGRGYRETRNGRFEAYVSDHSQTIFLGTHDTSEDARYAVLNYRISKMQQAVGRYSLHLDDGVVFMDRYIAFPEGLIFNLYGDLMHGAVDRNGYIHGLFNNVNIQYHRIIASLFCPTLPGKDYVNHIDGNKQNNCASNLEWVTRSENALHSYEHSLQNNIAGVPTYSIAEKAYMYDHCFDDYNDVARALNRNPNTVRRYMARYRKEYINDQN